MTIMPQGKFIFKLYKFVNKKTDYIKNIYGGGGYYRDEIVRSWSKNVMFGSKIYFLWYKIIKLSINLIFT